MQSIQPSSNPDQQKSCFVIMPISDMDGYPRGHFRLVYDFIIRPACVNAGFQPVRADEVMTTNYIALDIIDKILKSDMAICDLSGKNPNVLYELGIRQAFNMPVTLIKDIATSRIFDISGFRDVEYDESLRIDTVQTTIDELQGVLINTYDQRDSEINSLVSLLGIKPAKVPDTKEISIDTSLILNAINSLYGRMDELETKGRDYGRTFPVKEDRFEDSLTMVNGASIQLSDKEIEILRAICAGLSTPEISKRVFLSHRTIEGMRSALLEKLGVKSTAGLVVWAIRNGIYT